MFVVKLVHRAFNVGVNHDWRIDHGNLNVFVWCVVFADSFFQQVIPKNLRFQKRLNFHRISWKLLFLILNYRDPIDLRLHQKRIRRANYNLWSRVNSVHLCYLRRNLKLCDWSDLFCLANKRRLKVDLLWWGTDHVHIFKRCGCYFEILWFLFEAHWLDFWQFLLWFFFRYLWRGSQLYFVTFFRGLYPKNLINSVDQVTVVVLKPRISKNILSGLLFVLFEDFFSFAFSLLLNWRHGFGLLFLNNGRLQVCNLKFGVDAAFFKDFIAGGLFFELFDLEGEGVFVQWEFEGVIDFLGLKEGVRGIGANLETVLSDFDGVGVVLHNFERSAVLLCGHYKLPTLNLNILTLFACF